MVPPPILERDFGEKSRFFRKETLPLPGQPRILPISIWCKMSAIRRDLGAFRGEFRLKALRKCITAGFQGGRLGGLPVFLAEISAKNCDFRKEILPLPGRPGIIPIGI